MLDVPHEYMTFHVKCCRHLEHNEQRWLALPALHVTAVGPTHVGHVGKRLLRQARRLPQVADDLPNNHRHLSIEAFHCS